MNYYYSTSANARVYASTNPASDYEQFNGNHTWYSAPSGTIGTSVSLTPYMTLTAAGRLLINTPTESTFTLDVNGTGRFIGASASPTLTLANSIGGTLADFTITENTGLIVNSYEGASARSIDFRVANASALLIASTGAATFSSSVSIPSISGLILGQTAVTDGIISSVSSTVGLNFKIGTTSALYINGSATPNVGIGTTSTLQTLTLAGTQMMYNTAGDGNTNTIIGSITSQVRNYGAGIANSSFASIQFATDPTTWFKGDIRFLTNSSDGTASAGTERMRITSDGYVRLTSSSGGIQFNGDTAAANALDDYEEGEFTPTLTIGGSSAGITYQIRKGAYTRVGRLVTIQLGIKMTSIGSNTGNLTITGLPFSVISDSYYHPYGVVGVILNQALLPLYALGSGATIDFRKANTTADVSPTNSDIDDDTYIFVTMTYSAS
jgi:hypothetical protein